jgi:hypothetical protein
MTHRVINQMTAARMIAIARYSIFPFMSGATCISRCSGTPTKAIVVPLTLYGRKLSSPTVQARYSTCGLIPVSVEQGEARGVAEDSCRAKAVQQVAHPYFRHKSVSRRMASTKTVSMTMVSMMSAFFSRCAVNRG